ncbi:MAG: acyl-CoA dehydrogenase [Desulfatitalea sp.]|nr:acyl-CoA dehydrogenase [Desulfatitalea sp.]NNK02363.1 acyl-CoA dehydrogenase [Desulfatitalea sp.]
MAQVIADRKDIDFVLHEQFKVGDLAQHDRFAEFPKKVVDMVITEARNLAVKEILPTFKIGDEVGCKFEKGVVTTPEEFHRAWALLREGEWMALTRDPKWGGQGMPETIAIAARDYFIGANMALLLCVSLTHGAARLVELFGTAEQKETYLKNMYTGKWGGTMLLTEPEAGSDLGALTTVARKNPDGTYSITGNKIFITSGEHDLTENIIHPVLARIEGAPEGSRGISLFLVPKFHVNPDGSPGERNDVFCTGIEEKMGIHGSPTCSMALGEKGNCIGTLLGEENKGLAEMFVMMNEERLLVASQSLSSISSAYLYALDYARKRVQSAQAGVKGGAPVAIINHPDVRLMLLTMKMYLEGFRSLIYYIANCEDQKHVAEDAAQKERFQNLIDVLIPVAKGYGSDRAVEMCSMGLQVFGGYGYTCDYPMEQLLRDVRICPIYEGTNGIQALDLIGRKLGMKNGQLFTDMLAEIKKTLQFAKGVDAVGGLANRFEELVDGFALLSQQIAQDAKTPEALKRIANASPFLHVTGDVVMGWMVLWRAAIAAEALAKGAKKKDVAFYEGQLQSARFFVESILPVTQGRMAAVSDPGSAVLDISDDAFGGK